MEEIKAPGVVPNDGRKKVFFAGSIEMGAAENWQERLKNLVSETDIIILNPRRDDWDSSWEQKIENPQFREQVEWELDCLDMADLVIVYFDGSTKSPITLMELGLHARNGKAVVYCPDSFWRKGNVDIVCNRYGVPQADSIEELAEAICDISAPPVILTMEMIKFGVPDSNGRIYANDSIDMNALVEHVNRGFMYGKFNDGQYVSVTTSLDDVTHIIKKVWLDGDKLMGQIQLLDNPKGRSLRSLAESLEVVPRVLGTIGENDVIHVHRVLTFDLK